MRINGVFLRDRLGWPVEHYPWRRRPVTNVIRLLLHTNWRETWECRHMDGATRRAALSGEYTSTEDIARRHQ